MNRRHPALAWVLLTVCVSGARAAEPPASGKLDAALQSRARAPYVEAPATWTSPRAMSRVIVRTRDGRPASDLIQAVGGTSGRYFPWLGGQVGVVPDASLAWLASRPDVAAISLDRPVQATAERVAATIGAAWVTERLGVDGTGVGIATIDSGVAATHADLNGRVVHFADFVNGQQVPYDDYGHGTHVAGIIAGNGHDSNGARRGIAPGAHLIVLKALDLGGNGYTSNVIAAIDYAIANRTAYNIRVLNLSVAAGVYESYLKDPLTLAAKRAVDAGIVVVAAAGNRGHGAGGRVQYGGIASPGNAPWVLTVGATNDLGTADRRDDIVAPFSARGPAAIDGTAKPDLVAPGVGIESTTDAGTALYNASATSRIWGTVKSASEPYLSLTGTSMSAPVVTGAIALMLQVNAALTPNAVKAILQFTAEARDGYDHLTQGAGFLNARGAVELARAFAASSAPDATGDPVRWSRHILWGNNWIGGGTLAARANAWTLGVTWGDSLTPAGEPIGWGTGCDDATSDCTPAPWTVSCDVATQSCDAQDVLPALEDVSGT